MIVNVRHFAVNKRTAAIELSACGCRGVAELRQVSAVPA